jgi:hypothetical protein
LYVFVFLFNTKKCPMQNIVLVACRNPLPQSQAASRIFQAPRSFVVNAPISHCGARVTPCGYGCFDDCIFARVVSSHSRHNGRNQGLGWKFQPGIQFTGLRYELLHFRPGRACRACGQLSIRMDMASTWPLRRCRSNCAALLHMVRVVT